MQLFSSLSHDPDAYEEVAAALVVDDEAAEQEQLERHLRACGYRVEKVSGGQEALDALEYRYYPVVVAKWLMPQMDGIELCRRIRERGGPYTYVLMCANRGNKTHRMIAFEAGVDDILYRPFEQEELAARLAVARRVIGLEQRVSSSAEELENASRRLHDAQRLLMVASTRFEELFDGLPIACFTVDHDFRIREWNRESEELFQVPPYQAVDHVVWEIFKGKSRTPWTREFLARVLRGESLEQVEWSMRRADGNRCHMLANIFPLRGMDNEIRGIICANVDITARKLAESKVEEQMRKLNVIAQELELERIKLEEANSRLEHMAVTDVLTGLRNRRAFQDLFEEEFAKHRRNEQPLSLVLLDIDRFKNLNDTHGHSVGDQVLREFAEVLRQTSQVGEFAARYGGEEFVIVMVNQDAEQAMARAEIYRQAIEAHPFHPIPVTASFGVATATGNLHDPNRLVDHADEALYESKRAGRNRCTHFGHMPASLGKAA